MICYFHWGIEGKYTNNKGQAKSASHGRRRVPIWSGHHPMSQNMDTTLGIPVFYSLGNFSFGGNRNPGDKDTVIIQEFIRALTVH